MQIAGRSTLVVGGASGLGEAVVRRLHSEGAHVVVADVNVELGQSLVGELGARVTFVSADVSRHADVERAVATAAGKADGLRIVVCCAGIAWGEKLAGRCPHSIESFERVVAVNLLGTFNVLRLSASAMIDAAPLASGERGVCITTSSIAAFDGQAGQYAYAATKGAIAAGTLPAARDLAPFGIRVCSIAPGTFDTPLLAKLPQQTRDGLSQAVPFPSRLGRPDEYADLVRHIVSNEMLNGEVVRLDGALRMPPR